MNEFELIRTYFSSLASKGAGKGMVVGIGDDCAILSPPKNTHLVVSTDTLISGVHFPEHTSASDIGFKALAVNLSDLAAMGADPLWFTLCITLPSVEPEWLEQLCDGMAELVSETGIQLVGGDTTRGPLSISIHVTGTVPVGEALTRSGAIVGDDIYVSGDIGVGAVGLALALSGESLPNDADLLQALQRFNRPQPRLLLGRSLRGIASSCIDISDGLLADLQHSLVASGVAGQLSVDAIPLSPAIMHPSVFTNRTVEKRQQIAVNGGDDYELCFTSPASAKSQITALAETVGLPLTKIGTVTAGCGMFDSDKACELTVQGYQHFS